MEPTVFSSCNYFPPCPFLFDLWYGANGFFFLQLSPSLSFSFRPLLLEFSSPTFSLRLLLPNLSSLTFPPWPFLLDLPSLIFPPWPFLLHFLTRQYMTLRVPAGAVTRDRYKLSRLQPGKSVAVVQGLKVHDGVEGSPTKSKIPKNNENTNNSALNPPFNSTSEQGLASWQKFRSSHWFIVHVALPPLFPYLLFHMENPKEKCNPLFLPSFDTNNPHLVTAWVTVGGVLARSAEHWARVSRLSIVVFWPSEFRISALGTNAWRLLFLQPKTEPQTTLIDCCGGARITWSDGSAWFDLVGGW